MTCDRTPPSTSLEASFDGIDWSYSETQDEQSVHYVSAEFNAILEQANDLWAESLRTGEVPPLAGSPPMN